MQPPPVVYMESAGYPGDLVRTDIFLHKHVVRFKMYTVCIFSIISIFTQNWTKREKV